MHKIWMGFDIKTSPAPMLQPQKIEYWKPHQFKDTQPESPFHYKADALVGLSLIQLNQHLQNPFTSPQMNFSFAAASWKTLEPHHELYARSQPRISALRKHTKECPQPLVTSFERKWTEILDACQHPWGMDLQHLGYMLDAIDYLEESLKWPLLYNYSIQFSRPVLTQMHHLHSLLFNLRALMAMDYNAYVQDPTFESVKVDSISDYLAKCEYVANDALLYWKLKRSSSEMPAKTFEKLSHYFQEYSHNAVCLIESLPKSFLSGLPQEQMDDTLYLTQMDWLLGTDAGLLFRVREEIYGLMEGYHQIFWPELDGKSPMQSHQLSVNCLLTEKDAFPTVDAA